MNIPQFIMGIAAIGIGLLIVVKQKKRLNNGLEDEWGYQKGTLISGIGFIVIGIIIMAKSF